MEEFVLDFTDNFDQLTPIELVSELTGLDYDEIRSCYETVEINTDKMIK